MKSLKLLLMAALTISTVSVIALGNSNQEISTPKEKISIVVGDTVFYCPMKCEGDKTYPKAGKCPVCKMNLKAKVTDVEAAQYQCPMKCEGDKTYNKPGKCPVCKMNLKEVKKEAPVYFCPMKCEGDKTYSKPGKCPVCKMNLKEKKSDHADHQH